MKRGLICSILLLFVVGYAFASPGPDRKRFVWEESITIPIGATVYTSPINTAYYNAITVHFESLDGQLDLVVTPEGRIFEDESFGMIKSWWSPGWIISSSSNGFTLPISWTETRLRLDGNQTAPITIKITCGLKK